VLKNSGQTKDGIRRKSIINAEMLYLFFPLPLVEQIVYLLSKRMLLSFSQTLIVCACGAP